MPEISGTTLMMAIQAVESKMAHIGRRLDDVNRPNGAELESLLPGCDKAATALRIGYEAALEQSSNLAPYDTLVRRVV